MKRVTTKKKSSSYHIYINDVPKAVYSTLLTAANILSIPQKVSMYDISSNTVTVIEE